MEIEKRISLRFFIITSILMMIGLVNAFGVGISYSPQDPLRLYPGESREVLISLQNLLSEENLTVVSEILEGQDIAEIINGSKQYLVIAGQEIGAEVFLNVNVPRNAVVGKEYLVRLIFKDVTKREGGMVGFSTSIVSGFNVLIVENPSESKNSEFMNIIWIVLIIAIIIVIVLLVYFKIRSRHKVI